jgi:O-acetyl-ADP-ribose deacetylase (regulator of RNase III)
LIEEIQGDVFKAKEKVLIHGCNCFNTFGSGVAKIVKELYPGAYEADQETEKGDTQKLGSYTVWSGKHYYYDQDIIVINSYSQYGYGSLFNKQVQLQYDKLRESLEQIEFVYRGASFAMPRIGAGLARGDWATIKEIIEEVFTGYKKNELVRIYYL